MRKKNKLVYGFGVNDADYVVNPRINGKQAGGRKDENGKMHSRDAHPVASITMEALPTLEALVVEALNSRGI